MKPRVITSCISNLFASKNERIVEFESGGKSGLISFRNLPDGTLLVDVGRCDPGILVLGPRRPPMDQDLPLGWEKQ